MSKDLTILPNMISEIMEIMQMARNRAAQQVNSELLTAYWNIGRVIVENEQKNSERAEYGKETLRQLSHTLTKEFGKGFSLSNIYNMRQFYIEYPIFQSVTGKLTWTHYCELMTISDPDRRSFYEKECERSGWSVREMPCSLLGQDSGSLVAPSPVSTPRQLDSWAPSRRGDGVGQRGWHLPPGPLGNVWGHFCHSGWPWDAVTETPAEPRRT